MIKFFEKFMDYMITYVAENTTMVIISAIVVVLAIVLIVVGAKVGNKGLLTTKVVTTGAICLALSLVLNMIPIISMPNGGSVTIGRLVPLLVFAYIYGFNRGLILGAVYGVLDFIAKPYFLNIIQVLLDYPLAFAGVAFAGILFFNKTSLKKVSFALGTIICGLSRWVFSTISGAVFFAEYLGLPEGYSTLELVYASAVYNSVLLLDTLICLVIILILCCFKSFNNMIDTRRLDAQVK